MKKEGYFEALENNELILLSILSWSVNNRLTLWTLELHTLVIFGLDCTNMVKGANGRASGLVNVISLVDAVDVVVPQAVGQLG